jgi:hypothetical protein
VVGSDLWVLAHSGGSASTRLLRVTIDTGEVELLATYPKVLASLSATPASFE